MPIIRGYFRDYSCLAKRHNNDPFCSKALQVSLTDLYVYINRRAIVQCKIVKCNDPYRRFCREVWGCAAAVDGARLRPRLGENRGSGSGLERITAPGLAMAREAAQGDALAAFAAAESLRAAPDDDEQARIEAMGLLIYSCAGHEVDRAAQTMAAVQGGAIPLLVPLLGGGSLHQRMLAGNTLLILCFKHADNAARVGASRALEAAVANALAPTGRGGLALIANDGELVRQISVGMLSNVAAFSERSHARLIEAGAHRMGIAVLEALFEAQRGGATGVAVDPSELHDKLIAWSVSLLHCLSDSAASGRALVEAGAIRPLLRIAQSPHGHHFPVSAALAVGNLYRAARRLQPQLSAELIPAASSVHIPGSVLRQCVEALPAALRGEVYGGYYFLPSKVAMGIRNLLALADDHVARGSGILLSASAVNPNDDVEVTHLQRMRNIQDGCDELKRSWHKKAMHEIKKHSGVPLSRADAVVAAAVADIDIDAIGVPVEGIRAIMVQASAVPTLALMLAQPEPQRRAGYTDKREEEEERVLHRRTLEEGSATLFELVVGHRSLESDLLAMPRQGSGDDYTDDHMSVDLDELRQPIVGGLGELNDGGGLGMLARVIAPLLEPLRRLAWAKASHSRLGGGRARLAEPKHDGYRAPQWTMAALPMDLVEMVAAWSIRLSESDASEHNIAAAEIRRATTSGLGGADFNLSKNQEDDRSNGATEAIQRRGGFIGDFLGGDGCRLNAADEPEVERELGGYDGGSSVYESDVDNSELDDVGVGLDGAAENMAGRLQRAVVRVARLEAAMRFVNDRHLGPPPNYWASTQLEYHAVKTWTG